MDITPAFKIACMTGVGFLLGTIAKTNAKMTALTWMIAEIFIQIVQKIEPLQPYRLELPVRLITGALACEYLSERHLINKTAHATLPLVAFNLLPEVFKRLKIKPVISFD